jgi:hypothetical protein
MNSQYEFFHERFMLHSSLKSEKVSRKGAKFTQSTQRRVYSLRLRVNFAPLREKKLLEQELHRESHRSRAAEAIKRSKKFLEKLLPRLTAIH